MDGKIDLFTLLTLVVAIVTILKLRSVLGRRTGDEDARVEQRRRDASAAAGAEKVVKLPRRDKAEPVAAERVAEPASGEAAVARIKSVTGGDESLTSGLMEILKADPSFDPDGFVRGARQAYEMIVTAFAEGNRKTLRDLLNRDVLDSFTQAISEREQRGEQVDQSFVGINKADLLEAEMKGGFANITVRFVSQLISATRDRGGNVVSGDPSKIKEVVDIWTFSRDVSTARARSNPNWKLVATVAPN